MDKLKGGSEAGLTPSEAMTGIGLYAIIADERVMDAEMETLRLMLRRMRLFQDHRLIGQGLDKALRIVKSHGDEALLRRASEALPAQLGPTAFALAADLMLADGDVADAEEEALDRIEAALRLEPDVADRIIEVMRIRNMG